MARRFLHGFERLSSAFTLVLLCTALLMVHPGVALEYAPGCSTTCGNVTVQYPFGFTEGCGLPDYRLNCTNDTDVLREHYTIDPVILLSTPSGRYQVMNVTSSYLIISAWGILRASVNSTNPWVNGSGLQSGPNAVTFEIAETSPYVISDKNIMFGYGCNVTATFTLLFWDWVKVRSCTTDCNFGENKAPYCDYYACCGNNMPTNEKKVVINATSYINKTFTVEGYASIMDTETYYTPDYIEFGLGRWGMRLLWYLAGSCDKNRTCSDNSQCLDVPSGGRLYGGAHNCICNEGYDGDGYRNGTGCFDVNECEVANNCSANAICTNTIGNYSCSCPLGYVGTGYGGVGCTDINECANAISNACAANATCNNLPGTYDCSCLPGFSGDGFKNGTSCTLSVRNNRVAIIAGASSASLVFFLSGLGLVVWCCMRKRRKMQGFTRRNIKALGNMKDFFLSLSQGEHTATLYTLKELEKATKHFSDDLVLGAGGFGTVYKGTLDNGLEVAIKKTNQVDVNGSQQFLNEVSVLSQVNHRNLVRLHGCCLEIEVPMLVYEYVANGDLSQHLQGERSGPHLNWEKRFQIAMETAEALRYLHSAANPPIFHRDMKTSNILLDDKFNVKVADFGISRLVKPDATHVSTAVQGTPGYLDPEYFHSYHLTDKSDVYSFGVVLLELITSLKPLDFARDTDDINLAAMVLPLIRKGNVEAIIDPKLIDEDASDFDRIVREIQGVAELASQCLANHRVDRPSMKEVVAELFAIKGIEQRGVNYGSDHDQEGIERVPMIDEFTPNSTSSSNASQINRRSVTFEMDLQNRS